MAGLTNAELSIVLKLKDEMTKELSGVQGKVNRFGDTIKENWLAITAGATAAILVFRQVANTVKDLVEAAQRQEDAVNRLNTALQIQGTFSSTLSSKYQALASEMQNVTRYGDEGVLEVMQTLVSVGNVVPSQMDRTTKAVLDFSTATGRDLNSAAMAIAKAAAGSTGELARYGIVLDESIPKSQRFEAALGFIEKRFGGAAQKDVHTFAGQMAQLANNFSDVKEELGSFITQSEIGKEVIGGLSNAFRNVADSLKRYRELQKKVEELELKGDIQTQIDLLESQKKQLESTSSAVFSFLGSLFTLGLGAGEREQTIALLSEAISKLRLELKQIGDTTYELQEKADIEKALTGDPEKIKEKLDLNFENILAHLEMVKEAKALASEDEQTRLQAYYDWLNQNDLLTTDQKIQLLNKQAEAYKKQGADALLVEQWLVREKEKINKAAQETEAKAIKARWEAIVSLSQSSVSILRSAARLSGESWLDAAAIMIEGLASVAKAIATLKAITAPTPWDKAVAIAEVAAAIMSTVVALKGIEDAKKKLSEATVGELNIPKMAEGGIVNRPTLLLAGERGREAIVPLDRGMNISAPINNTFHFSITISGTNDEIREKLENEDFWRGTVGRTVIKVLNEQNGLVLGSIWDK